MALPAPEVTVETDCAGCGARLVVVATPYKWGETSTFSVRCLTCGKRVPLVSAVGTVKSVSLATADN